MTKQRGFTLIELLIVIAIVGILSAIAVPQYSDYIARSRISEAISALSGMSVKMEQYFQDNRTYYGSCVDPVTVTNNLAPRPRNTSTFTYTCQNLTASTYKVTATGIGSMNGFIFSIDQSGLRTTDLVPAGWIQPTNCWVLKKDGSC